jgi:hypothetical protein
MQTDDILSDLGLEKSLLSKGRRALDNLKIPLSNRKREEPLRFVLYKLSVSSTGQTIEGSLITSVSPQGIGRAVEAPRAQEGTNYEGRRIHQPKSHTTQPPVETPKN